METHRKPRKQGLEHFVKFVRDLPDTTPRVMFNALHELGYRGQDSARRAHVDAPAGRYLRAQQVRAIQG